MQRCANVAAVVDMLWQVTTDTCEWQLWHCKGAGRAGCSCSDAQAQLQLRGEYSTSVQT